jgi:hypothetical protein
LFALCLAAACTPPGGNSLSALPTNTLSPLVSMTPRFTATPVPSKTPLPSATFTPSDTPITPTPSNTPTPSATPPITGIVASLQTVNVREGPGVNFSAIKALVPGTGVEVVAQSQDGRWMNIRMDDGTQGWIATSLVRINPTPTIVPTATPSPDLTLMALGTPLPTAIFGGSTITPTPPRGVTTPTPATPFETISLSPPPEVTESLELPIIDVTAIQQTIAAQGTIDAATPTPTATEFGVTATFTPFLLTPQGDQSGGSEGSSVGAQRSADVLAYCDRPRSGRPAPKNLKAGTVIRVYWGWFASTEANIRQHVANAVYDVRVDGTPLTDWKLYRDPDVRKQNDGRFWVYWFVPYGPLLAGEHVIAYKVTWNARITDGFEFFGPGTDKLSEEGTCTFTVQAE